MIRFQQLAEDAIVPTKAHKTDAGWDLYALEEVSIEATQIVCVPTGIAVAIPECHVGFVCPRSGMAAKKGLTVINAPGTIDAGYRGELKVLLHYAGCPASAFVPVKHVIKKGDRIAQLVVCKLHDPEGGMESVTVDNLPAADRGDAGFGSTGA